MTGVTEERSFVEEARRAKLPALKALGVQPFAYRFDRTHTSAQALTAYDDSMGEAGPEWTASLGLYEAMTILADGRMLLTPGFPSVKDP